MAVKTPPKPNPHPTTVATLEREAPVSRAELGVVWTIWLTYGAFYFCRTNLSAAVPSLKASVADGGLGLSPDQVGWILASLKIAYGLGQLLNGQLAEKISPRWLLAAGMFASAGLNVLFGFGTSFYFLLFIWAMNGYCQSLGWPPSVRIVCNWVPVWRRGKALGIVGTGYQITLGVTYFVAGQSAYLWGWRYAMYVPAAMLAAVGIFMLLVLRDAPFDNATGDELQAANASPVGGSWFENVLVTLSNPALWLLGLSLALLNACRYGFVDWGITHLMDMQDINVGKAGLTFVVFAAGAAAGSYLAGWMTDRFFGSRRAPVICLLLLALCVLTLAYEWVAQHSAWGTIGLLVAIGFCIFGPQVLLVGTAPADLARKGTAAAAVGFVNFLGYMGASAGDVVTGHYIKPASGGWHVAIYIWAGWALAAAILAGLLWNMTARREEKT